MPTPPRSRPKKIRSKFCGGFASIILRFSLLYLIYLNLHQAEQIDFCYNGPKTGQRLNTTLINATHARTGLECIIQCLFENKSCRSVNFHKEKNESNCEFLRNVSSEEPADLLFPDDRYDYFILLTPNRTALEQVSSSTPPRSKETPSKNQALGLFPSCKELFENNSFLSDGIYTLRNTKLSAEEYEVYCHMTEISECGPGGWTLVLKIDGNKTDFNYSSPYWTNKETYAVQDGLEGLTEKQTKLASYWNTPFKKICLGMKVNGVPKWIMIDYQASSLFNVIASETPNIDTNVGKDKWLSLMDNSVLYKNHIREGFNIKRESNRFQVRIGMKANKENKACTGCVNSCIGFGMTIRGCDGEIRKTTCGNIVICSEINNKNTAAFGYTLVQ